MPFCSSDTLRRAGVAVAIACLGIAGAFAAGGVAANADGASAFNFGPHHGQPLVVSASQGNDNNPCTYARPCATISHAVSVASSGDRIVVERGTYAEEVDVSTSLTLQASGHVLIDATGHVNGIVVSGAGAAGSTVRGFDVQNAIGEGILAVSTSNVTVENNHLSNNDTGVNTDATQECAPAGEVPGDCGEALHLMSVVNARVIGNTIENNIGGILITDELGPSHGNLVLHNVSRNNSEDCGITLPSHNPAAVGNPSAGGVYNNVIAFNVSDGNGGAGVGMFAPFPGAASYNNLVVGNVLENNGEAGVGVHSHARGQNVAGNVIIGNFVSGNGIDPDSGSGHSTGIALFSAVDATHEVVLGNRIANEYWGIFVAGPVTVTSPQANSFASSVTNPTN